MFEDLADEVGNRHRQDAEQLAPVPGGEAPEGPAQPKAGERVGPRQLLDVGRGRRVQVGQEPGEALDTGVEGWIRRGVPR